MRLNNGHKYTGTPGISQASLLRSFFVANLTQWSVSSIYTFGGGTTQRDYMVLYHPSGGQILVYHPNGNDADLDNGIYSSYKSTKIGSANDHPLAFSYNPDGGFREAFVAVLDPINSSFWDHITVTQGKRTPIKTYMIDNWWEGRGSMDVYFIEDDSREFLAIHCGHATYRYGTIVIARDLIDNTYEEGRLLSGLFFLDPTDTASPPNVDSLCSFWNTAYARGEWDGDFETITILQGAVNSNMPVADGSYPTTKVFVWHPDGWAPFWINSKDMRFGPRAPELYKVADLGNEFISLYLDYWVPWDEALGPPL